MNGSSCPIEHGQTDRQTDRRTSNSAQFVYTPIITYIQNIEITNQQNSIVRGEGSKINTFFLIMEEQMETQVSEFFFTILTSNSGIVILKINNGAKVKKKGYDLTGSKCEYRKIRLIIISKNPRIQ